MRVRSVRGEHVLRAVNDTCWAILPEKLQQISAVLTTHAGGGHIPAEEVRAAVAQRRDRDMQQRGVVAVLPLTGTLLHRATSMDESSGLVSLERWGALFDMLVDDPQIEAIVLDVESPGGSVLGVHELAARVFEARSKKRIVAVANALMASAAYYIASAATEVIAAPSSMVGSIGVIHLHLDFSRYADRMGITPTFTTAGKYKGEGNDLQPLSEEAQKHFQEMCDEYYALFTSSVAKHRGVKEEAVRNGYGEARALPARLALEAGLVDRIASLEEVLGEFGVSRGRVASARAEALTPPKASEDVPQEGPPNHDVPDARGGAPAAIPTLPANAAPTAEGDAAMHEGTAAPTGAATATVVEIGADASAKERKRAAEIVAKCAAHGMVDRAGEWIEQGLTPEQVGNKILDAKASAGEARPVHAGPVKPDISEKERKPYFLSRAILAMADKDWSDAGYEREVHQETERLLKANETGYTPQGGLLLPTGMGMPLLPGRAWDGRTPSAALRTTSGQSAGEHFVFTEPGSFIDLLRNRLVLTAMGATFLPGLQGNVSFPKQTASGNFEWRGEAPGSDQNDSDAETGQVTLSPKEGQATTAFTRRLLAQSVIAAEMFVRNDLMKRAALGIDLAGLHGTGQNNQPTGVYVASDVNSVAIAGLINYASAVEMETAIVADNADIGAMGYVTTPEVRGAAKVTQVFQGTNGAPLWTGSVTNGEMNGYRAMASNQVSKVLGTGTDEHGLLFGVWAEMLIGEWGATEVIVDQFTKKKQGLIEVTLHLMVDIALRHAEAFSKATGLVLALES